MHDATDGWQRTWQVMALAVWLCAGAAQATADCTFYVRAGFVPAEGPPNGRSPESAFPTIKEGAKALANPGDVLCVGPGLYVEGNIGVSIDGSPGPPEGGAGNPVEFRADASGGSTHDAPGPVQIVPPPGDNIITTAFLIFGRHDIMIDGFTMSGFSDAGIQVRANSVSGASSSAIAIRNNLITGCKTGIDVIARDGVVIADNVTLGNEHSGIAIEACLFTEGEGRCRDLSGAPVRPVVSNNRSGGNGAHGISIRAADDAVIRHNLVYANAAKGIVLEECNDALVANNLVYANGEQAVAIGKADASPDAVVVNNTLYGNGSWGVDVGNSTAGSPGAAVVNNVIWRNHDGQNGVGVLNEDSGTNPVRPASTCRYLAGFNVIEANGYGPDTPHNQYDIHADPLLVDPAGADGILGGEHPGAGFVDRSADDDFRLRQTGPVSPAVDAGSATVSEIGLDGSTASDGRRDQGVVDVGFHYGASVEHTLTFTPPFMPLYVRVGGSDAGDGFTPGGAFAHIAMAAARAEAGITVVVGPGRYADCNRSAPAKRGLSAFFADTSGDQTGDAPGVVLLDASQCRFNEQNGMFEPGEAGFDISSTCGVVVDGFHITGATEDGIRVDDHSDGAVLRNNVVFGAGKRAIHVINSDDVRIANNLLFANRAGIQIGGANKTNDPTTPGCRRAQIEFNTALNSQFNGIQVGDGIGVSSQATLRYNVTAGSGQHGVEVGDDSTRRDNLRGFKNDFNFIGDGYGTGITRGEGDLLLDPTVSPLYLDPSVVDVSGDWLLDTHFRLVQNAAGQASQSRAVDAVPTLSAVDAGMADRSTRSDGVADSGEVDLGYHYPRRGTLAGDCDGDGVVRIDELVLAVNIAIDAAPMSACAALDGDGDGQAEINELVRAVTNGLRG